ncbi:MAG TPA: isoprenyl transferase [Bacteroidia bacterium]|jgi:undecaprenyl diphosphate synthase|nr:isoprenyl transferase [Bacteroidia bacterium]
MKSLKEQVDLQKLPRHIAVIMDGNGRWAKLKGASRIFGHQNGVKSVKETVEAAAELGIEYLTMYAFSTENWNRPADEVQALMELLIKTIYDETPTLNKNNIRLLAIGDIKSLPEKCRQQLTAAMKDTAKNTRLNLVLALSYSAKWEILEAVKQIAEEAKAGKISPAQINESVFESHLSTAGIPHPELMIRTSGECRISNFLLWQLAYAEFYFTETLWPDFRRDDFYKAIISYQNRERRFGKTGEQVKNSV